MTDDIDLELPDFLDRKKNGIVHEHIPGLKRADRKTGIVWPKKRNWRKIVERRRRREKAEEMALLKGSIVVRRGQ